MVNLPKILPMWARIGAALLLVSLVGGQVWQRRPAGWATHLVLTLVERHCPAALRRQAEPSIADGARALDRWGYRVLADLVDQGEVSRCRTDAAAGNRDKLGKAG